jgi:hypothetical protein
MRTTLLCLLAALASNLLFAWWGRTTFVPLGLVVVGGLLLLACTAGRAGRHHTMASANGIN